MTDTTDRAELLAMADRHIAQIDYSVELQRIIEDLCHNRPIREPKSGAKHYYEMAVAYRLAAQDQKPVAWQYEMSWGITESGTRSNWEPRLSSRKPEPVEAESIRNVKPLYLSPPPAAAETNASAEARLREARLREALHKLHTFVLHNYQQAVISARQCDRFERSMRDIIDESLSAHSPASDCDKQGCMGDISSGDPTDLQELLAKPSVLEPSDRTADVTVEVRKLAQRYIDCTTDDMPPEIKMPTVNELGDALCALLDAFTVGRR